MVTPVMMSFSSSRHLLMRARLLRSSKGLVIFLYVCVLERGTSESPELPEAPLNFNWEGREMSKVCFMFHDQDNDRNCTNLLRGGVCGC